jgi:hypothetical protein
VLDDESDDGTADIVTAYANHDRRVRLLKSPGFDPGLWGKPQACAELAEHAAGETLLFMDADVRLARDAVARIAAALEQSEAALLSGVPEQITVSFFEKLIVPLIHFVLLGFLPLAAMRRSHSADFGVACGQLVAVERDAYRAAGGHRAIADKVHDGMALARALRLHGYMTDIADFTSLARCRLYRSRREVIAGFAVVAAAARRALRLARAAAARHRGFLADPAAWRRGGRLVWTALPSGAALPAVAPRLRAAPSRHHRAGRNPVVRARPAPDRAPRSLESQGSRIRD